MNVTVATFATDKIHNGTVASLLSLGLPAIQNGINIQYSIGSGPLIEKERSIQATWFLDHPEICGDVLMMIDSDIIFFNPWDCLNLIITCAKLKTLISGVYVVKTFPPKLLVNQFEFDKRPIYMNQGLRMMKYVPTGFLAIPRCALEDVAGTMRRIKGRGIPFYPLFATMIMHGEEEDTYLGEDYAYPIDPNMLVLGSDFLWKEAKSYKIGDTILGFDENAIRGYRYLNPTTITDVIHKYLPVWKIKTTVGEIVTTADHPWLAKRNWRISTHSSHVKLGLPRKWDWIRTDQLRTGDNISMPVRFSSNPIQNRDYMIGYLKGIWDGDGTICYRKFGEYGQDATLGQTDTEGIERVKQYLSELGVAYTTSVRTFDGHPTWKPLHSIRIRRTEEFGKFIRLLEEEINELNYMKGYLAGFFDAEGCNRTSLTVANKDRTKLGKVSSYLNVLGIEHKSIEKKTVDLGCIYIYRVTDIIDFFVKCQPAIKRKCVLKDRTLKHNDVKVIGLEQQSIKQDMVCLTTSSHTFIANGFASHNCERANAFGYYPLLDTNTLLYHTGSYDYSVKDGEG